MRHYTSALLKNGASLSDGPLQPVQIYMDAIEKNFKGKIDHISKIRRNRYIDKLLWVIGQKEK